MVISFHDYFLLLSIKYLNKINYLLDRFLILFVIFLLLHLCLYLISPTFVFGNLFANLMLSLLIGLLLFVLDSCRSSHFLELLSMFVLLFFVKCCLRMLIFYEVLKFRIDIPPFLCLCAASYCLFLFSFVISLKDMITLNSKHLFHVLLVFLLNFTHIKFSHLLQKYYPLELDE